MQSIYIHIPFCIKKCAYCSFNSLTDLTLIDKYIISLCNEIKNQSSSYKNELIKTIYIGGGTPTLLSPLHISAIITQLNKYFNISKDLEFSIEANPESINQNNMIEYRNLGINRISIGIQSFNDSELKYLGRIHTAKKAREALDAASNVFENINLDLIISIPKQTKNDVRKNITEALSFSPKHISCYELTYEQGTQLYNDALRFEDNGELYLFAQEKLISSGFNQYEISNYSKNGFECLHNLTYWSDESYLGLGLSAHSYDKTKSLRSANTDIMKDYLNENYIGFREPACEIDKFIMGLRKINGIPEKSISKDYKQTIESLIKKDILCKKNDRIAYTKKGLLLSNQVLLELMNK